MRQRRRVEAATGGVGTRNTIPAESILDGHEGREGEEEDVAVGGVRTSRITLAASASSRSYMPAEGSTPEKELEALIDSWKLPNFRGAEFTPYWSKVRDGVRNSMPPRELWSAIARTLAALQRLRTDLGAPISLTSTYRSTAYNAVIGGEPNSYHTKFLAIDFTCSAGDPEEWGERLRSYRGKRFIDPATKKTFTFRGGVGIYSSRNFVHLDTRGYDSDWRG